MAHFLRRVETGADGIEIMRIVDAAYESSRTGEVIKL
jgi:predicted dehydrogenase